MRRSPCGDKKGFTVASILESKELLIKMSHESSLEPLKVYHLDMQSSFRSYINYTNGTPQLCWGWSNWLQNCRFRVAVQSHRRWEGCSELSLRPVKRRSSPWKTHRCCLVLKSCLKSIRTSVPLCLRTGKGVKLGGPKVENAIKVGHNKYPRKLWILCYPSALESHVQLHRVVCKLGQSLSKHKQPRQAKRQLTGTGRALQEASTGYSSLPGYSKGKV